jgi:hypothetical protein
MNDQPIESPAPESTVTAPRRPRVKYQVFVSSTYVDLHTERERVVWAVLEARHIPVGMENFTATDERGWKTITRVIDDTDYYVLILAGLYGSVDPKTDISWTQREYEYATAKGIPVLAFIREQAFVPGDKVETDPDKRKKLQDFINRVRGGHLCKTWKQSDDLSAAVASALRNAIQDDADDDKSRPGWIRGDSLPSVKSFEELARLSSENARLRTALDAAQVVTRQRSVLNLVFQSTNEPVSSKEIEKPLVVINSGGLSGAMKRLVERRNRTVWLFVAVKNSGPVAARDVVVELRFLECRGVHLHLNHYSDSKERDDFVSSLRNPVNHRYVDAITSSGVRQRIKLIAPGVAEPLVRFGVELPVEAKLNTACGVKGMFNLVAEDGASASGEFSLNVKWTETEERERFPAKV